MDTIIPAVTPLRQLMLEDMRMRKLEPRTQEAYIRAVRKRAAYLHRSPDTASGRTCATSCSTSSTRAPRP